MGSLIELNAFITVEPIRLKCYKVPFSCKSETMDVNEFLWPTLRLLAITGLASATFRGGFLFFKGDKDKTLEVMSFLCERIEDLECCIGNAIEEVIEPISEQKSQIIREIFYRALNINAFKNYHIVKIRNTNFYILREDIIRKNKRYEQLFIRTYKTSNGTIYTAIRGLRTVFDFFNKYGFLIVDFKTLIFDSKGSSVHWIKLPFPLRLDHRRFAQVNSSTRYDILEEMVKLLFGERSYKVVFPDGDVVVLEKISSDEIPYVVRPRTTHAESL